MIVYNNETIKNLIMNALDKKRKGIEIDVKELVSNILKYADRDFGIDTANRKYTEEELQYSNYMHINEKDDNKVYVGQTKKKPKDRWISGKGYIKQYFYKHGIKGYSWKKDLVHIVLCYGLTLEEVDSLEIELISLFKTKDERYGYNVANGGNGAESVSDVTRQRMSEAQKGEKNHNYGKTHSDKTKRRMRRNHADVSGKNNPRSKKVYCDGIIFGCMKECANFYKITYDKFKEYIRTNCMPLEFQEKGLRYASPEDENVAMYEKYDKEIHGKSYKSKKYKKFSRRFKKARKLLNKDLNNKELSNIELFKDPNINKLYEEAKRKLEHCFNNDVVDKEIKQNNKCCYEGKTSKGNEYIIDNDNVFMKVSNGEIWFIVDLADYELIKDYRWRNDRGKIRASTNGKDQALTRTILGLKQEDDNLRVTFINDPLDFRRNNLRVFKVKKNKKQDQ